jgi:hypothetical protein
MAILQQRELRQLHFPRRFQTIYDLKSVYGEGISGVGQAIALLERSGAYLPNIQNFTTLVQLPLKNPTIMRLRSNGFEGPCFSGSERSETAWETVENDRFIPTAHRKNTTE